MMLFNGFDDAIPSLVPLYIPNLLYEDTDDGDVLELPKGPLKKKV